MNNDNAEDTVLEKVNEYVASDRLKALPHVTISSTISLTIARWTLLSQR